MRAATLRMMQIPFEITNWSRIERTRHEGEAGVAYWRTWHFGQMRLRMVEYSPGYRANHWCSKGHILLCLSGVLRTELADGRIVVIGPGASYQVGDDEQPHRSCTETGATLFIVD